MNTGKKTALILLFVYAVGSIFWAMVNVLIHFQWAVSVWNDVVSCVGCFLLSLLTVYGLTGKGEQKPKRVRICGAVIATLFLIAAIGSVIQIVREQCGVPALIGNLVTALMTALVVRLCKGSTAPIVQKRKRALIALSCVLAFVQICCVITPSAIVAGVRVGYPEEGMAAEQRVPFSYAMTLASERGSLELLEYDTPYYTNDGEETEITLHKRAWVYLPYGYYDGENAEKEYDVLYLSHGATYDENHFFNGGFFFSKFQNFFDHMIEDGKLEPMIVVTPCIYTKDTALDESSDLTRIYQFELREHIVPEAESRYRTYAHKDVSETSLQESRTHRAFGGYSMGGYTTNMVFFYNLDYFANFIPMSASAGNGAPYVEAIQNRFHDAYDKDDYKIAFCAGGRDGAATGTFELFHELQKPEYAAYFAYDNTLQDGNFAVYIGTNHRHGSEFVLEYLYVFLPLMFGTK